MKSYNGYRSWNAWNVSLWLINEEALYFHARSLAEQYGIDGAVRRLTAELEGQRTPDGATYNKTSIRSALTGII